MKHSFAEKMSYAILWVLAAIVWGAILAETLTGNAGVM